MIEASACGKGKEWLEENRRDFEKALPEKDRDAIMHLLMLYLIDGDERITEETVEETSKYNPETGEKIMTLIDRLHEKGVIHLLSKQCRQRFGRDYRSRLLRLPEKALRLLEDRFLKIPSAAAFDEWLAKHSPVDSPPKPKRVRKASPPPV